MKPSSLFKIDLGTTYHHNRNISITFIDKSLHTLKTSLQPFCSWINFIFTAFKYSSTGAPCWRKSSQIIYLWKNITNMLLQHTYSFHKRELWKLIACQIKGGTVSVQPFRVQRFLYKPDIIKKINSHRYYYLHHTQVHCWVLYILIMTYYTTGWLAFQL